jgi:phosphotransferase system enzyme I (PtsI)
MATEITLKGIGASAGTAVGPIFVFKPADLTIPDRPPASVEGEKSRFLEACEQAKAQLEQIRQRMEQATSAETADIIRAHISIVDDPALQEGVFAGVDGGQNAEQALFQTIEAFAQQFEAMEDEYFAARAADIRDVGRRLLGQLLGVSMRGFDEMAEASIVVAQDLGPSETASLNPDLVLALCTSVGGLTSHTAILARTLGIPAVVGVGEELLSLAASQKTLALDGKTGALVFNPSAATRADMEAAKQAQERRMQALMAHVDEPAQTAEGRRVEVAANIGDAASARSALEYGAEGVGLLRTEFLFLQDTTPPDEEKQVAIYREIFQTMQDRPVVVRTLDIGGDKPPGYIDFPEELNPFLGWRAIRLCLDKPDLFVTQLRAILRAAAGFNVSIMYPMISSVEELREANKLLLEARSGLVADGLEHAADVPVGIMIEIPAAVILAPELAAECDFLSIGTNDLTQYTVAVDRTNERVAQLYDPLHPAVLRLIRQTIDAGHDAGIWVGMCGELAGMREAIPILLGMGLDEFSMTASLIPEAKSLLRQLTDEAAQSAAEAVLALGTSGEIRQYMTEFLQAYD